VAWAEALHGDDLRPQHDAPPPPGWQPVARQRPAAQPDPLPVPTLRHLAYRRTWRREAPGLRRVRPATSAVQIFDATGLAAVERASGRLQWQRLGLRPAPGRALSFALDDDERLHALDAAGRSRWFAEAVWGDAAAHDIRRHGDRVVVMTTERDVIGLDAADGRPRWRHAIHYGTVVGTAAHGPMLWLTGEDGFLHGLDVTDGRPRFVVRLPGDAEGGPQLVPGGMLVGTNREPDRASMLTLHDPLSGRARWSRPLDGALLGAPLCTDDRTVALLDDGLQAHVVLLDLATGKICWRRPLDDADDAPQAQLLDGAICLKSTAGDLTVLEIEDGALRWSLPGDDPDRALRVNAPMVSARGLWLLPSTRIRAIDPRSGRVVHALDCGDLVPDWMHVWPEGDLIIAEDDAVACYLLAGHLAVVS
ncbi:MAG: PQQ-binding-like beta-propeller repeat protein, partial [Myxococcales bacterium]|nr:PQQ-binding-like beta-propeller repeat protein [Myxococcales bacterium]